jgi:hypothetical protein
MYRESLQIALLSCLGASPLAHADPIHAVAGGAYWHHDSHWVFPEKIGGYVRVGIPQDVAGSEDAVAHYAFVEDGIRNTASVDVYRTDSASATEHEAQPGAQLSSEGVFAVGAAQALSGTRRIYAAEGTSRLLGVYLIGAGEWRVTIRISGSRLEALDDFVRGQRWETLAGH